MKVLYNFGLLLYRQAIKIASVKNIKAKKLIAGQDKAIRFLEKNVDQYAKYIWIHASSLGEFEQGRPIIEQIKRSFPEFKLLLTFYSPSGYEIRKDYEGVDLISYLPFDSPSNAKRFLDLVNPEIVIFIKYEFWANYLLELSNRSVPTYLVSAIFRPSQIFFKPYGSFFRKLLKCYHTIFVQDEASKRLLNRIDIINVSVSGDTRFDRVIDIMRIAKDLPVIEQFKKGADLVLVAGSTWPKDEDYLIDYFNTHPKMKLIIAPHEIQESHIRVIISKLKRPYFKYSEAGLDIETDCLIIDSIGLLSSIYRYGDIAYIGGGFGVGIHNVLEAAVYGVPVLFGPNFHKFREAKGLIVAGGGFTVDNRETLAIVLNNFFDNSQSLMKAGKSSMNYVKSQSGATEVVIKEIFE